MKSFCLIAVFTALFSVLAGVISAQQTTKQVEEFAVLGTQPGEEAQLTDQQLEVLLSQLVSPSVRPQVLAGDFQEFRKKYLEAKSRNAQEAVLFQFNKDAQTLKNAPVELTRPEDVEILPPPAGDKRRWLEIKEWGINEETRMGPTIDCDKDPMAFAKARTLIIKALVERARIPGFDTAHKAAFLRAFDKCLDEGVNCRIELATDHPYLDWAVGGRGPAFNLHYNPDPTNERAVNAKTLVVFDEQFAEWYDVGCACGGNLGKKAGVSRKIGFRTDVTGNYVLCSNIEVSDRSGRLLSVQNSSTLEVTDAQIEDGLFAKVLEQPTGPMAGMRQAYWVWKISGGNFGDVGDTTVQIPKTLFKTSPNAIVSVESLQGAADSGKPEKVCRIMLTRKPTPAPPQITRNVPPPVENIPPPPPTRTEIDEPKPPKKPSRCGRGCKIFIAAAAIGGGIGACAVSGCFGGKNPQQPAVARCPNGQPATAKGCEGAVSPASLGGGQRISRPQTGFAFRF